MEKKIVKLRDKNEYCIILNYEELTSAIPTGNWQRVWGGENMLRELGLSKPTDFTVIAGSKSDIPSLKTNGKLVAGLDVIRNDNHGKTKISVYHYPIYNLGDGNFAMYTKPIKLKKAHHNETWEEWEKIYMKEYAPNKDELIDKNG